MHNNQFVVDFKEKSELFNSFFAKQYTHIETGSNLPKKKWILEYYQFYLTWYFKEVQYNYSAHRSAHLFIIAISNHSHIKRKQPQRTFFRYSCSVTMINVVKKYLGRKIHELNTLIGFSNDSESPAPNKYIVKNRLLQNNYWWLLPLFS